MSNTDFRAGLVPVDSLSQAGYKGKNNPYYVPSTYATALYVGDPVIVTGTANTSTIKGEFPAGTLPEVNKATAGATNRITGVITSFLVPFSGSTPFQSNYKPASTEAVVYVCDDPSVLYEIQADSTAAVAATDISTNANIIFTHSGDTVSGKSGAELNTSSMTADATYQLQIMRLVNRSDNALGTNAKLIVRINLSTNANALAGV